MADRTSQAALITGVVLSIKFPGDEDYEAVAEVTDYPEVGNTAQNVDVTTIIDTQKVYISGLPDPGEGSLKVNFVGGSTQHQRLFEAQYALPKETIMMKIENPDGTSFEWPAEIGGVKVGGGSPGSALQGVISFSKKGNIRPTWPTPAP